MVHFEVLALTATVYPTMVWATEIARILGRTPGAVVGPVRELAERGLLTLSDPARAQTRKRGLRQLVSISSEGRHSLFSECSAWMLEAELTANTSVEESMRLALVAAVIFGTAGYCFVGLATDRKARPRLQPSEGQLAPRDQKRLREHIPHVWFAFEELSKLIAEARRSFLEWEINTLERLWWHVRQRLPFAVKAYERIGAGEDPDQVLRELRDREAHGLGAPEETGKPATRENAPDDPYQ